MKEVVELLTVGAPAVGLVVGAGEGQPRIPGPETVIRIVAWTQVASVNHSPVFMLNSQAS